MWGKFFTWIAANLAIPIFWEFVKRYTDRKKFVESANPDDTDAKAIEKAKQDGWK
jgi:hypothetical protein